MTDTAIGPQFVVDTVFVTFPCTTCETLTFGPKAAHLYVDIILVITAVALGIGSPPPLPRLRIGFGVRRRKQFKSTTTAIGVGVEDVASYGQSQTRSL